MINANPDSYVYYQKLAEFYFGKKKFDAALAESNKGLNFAEGNKPRLLLQKIKILKELGQKEECLKTIQEAKQLAGLFPSKYKKTLTALSQLESSLVEIKK